MNFESLNSQEERRRIGMYPFSKEDLVRRAFLRTAYVMWGMWEEKGSSDTRLLLPPLIPEEYVIVGQSLDGRDHREHVVPRMVICDECHKMFGRGAGVEQAALFIRDHLKIVWISRREQLLQLQ